MDLGDDEAAVSRPSDLPQRMPDVRTYCDNDVVRSADLEWQIRDADD